MDSLPIFPLPNVVLFPSVFLPLHIFEPRYREMVADAIEGDRLIGMVLLRPGWQRDYEGRPPVYPIGCSGVITHVDRLPDGRYNIVLRGVERFRIVEEDDRRSYRRAHIEPLPESTCRGEDVAAIRNQRAKLDALLAPAVERRLADIAGSRTSPAKPESPRRCRMKISSTRWRSTSTSSRSKSRRCSNSAACAHAPSRWSSCSR